MFMSEILKQRRKALNLTQEQVADALGVTAPAVNKWEKGVTSPDLFLLPALARLLKTDPNTLLGFAESLTEAEITAVLNQGNEQMEKLGFVSGFSWVLEKTREYPNCGKLLHMAALLLEGQLMLSGLTQKEKEPYQEQISNLYKQAERSGDAQIAARSRFMMASRLVRQGDYPRAQQELDALPKWDGLDKRSIQAELWEKEGKTDKAAALLESQVFANLQQNMLAIVQLVRLAAQAGDDVRVRALAQAAKEEGEAFGMGTYWADVVPLEAAVRRQDAPECLALLQEMTAAIQMPETMLPPLLTSHLPKKVQPSARDMGTPLGKQLLRPLIQELRQNRDYDFLRQEPEFIRLLENCGAQCEQAVPEQQNNGIRKNSLQSAVHREAEKQ
jgi:transcriptional regulator with XRE-family HTH domain